MKFSIPLILSLLAFPVITFAQEAAETVKPVSQDSLSLWSLIQQGGWAMYPLGTCSLGMFFLIFHAWRETRPNKFFTNAQVNDAESAFLNGDIEKGLHQIESEKTLLARALVPALKKIQKDPKKTEDLFIENLEAEENSVAQWITYLNVISSIAPMIGLLGTVSGMISAFQTIGRGGMGRPELLAGDIGEALITTATGLVVGIPAMIAYFVMHIRLNSAMIATNQAGTNLIDAACTEER